MKIAVAGTGYVGLSIATLLSQKHEVVAVDVVPEKVEKINARQSPIADEYLEKKDKYSYFLNNQNSFVEVHNENAQSPRTLAVVKDSYANCMISFLAEHFSTIYVFDTRFYRNKVTDFINENNVSDVLFLYNMHTIDTDTGINTIN